jgi:hypothetical protein
MREERGYAMAALLVSMAVMAIMLSVALTVWRTAVQREREAELIFRGEQYAHAIELYQRRTGGFPQTLDVLEKTRAIRRLYKDPMTGSDFQPVYVGQVIAGQPVVPGQAGRGVGAQAGRGAGGAQVGRGAAAGANQDALAAFEAGLRARGGGMGAGQQPLAGSGGPIIGVVSRSSGDSLRLYNGRGKYNEWAFVATAMTQQAGAPTGGQNPVEPGRGGRATPLPGQQFFRGRQGPAQPAQPGTRPGGPGRGPVLPFPRSGMAPPGRP